MDTLFDHDQAKRTAQAFAAWLAACTDRPAEVLGGLHSGFTPVRMDQGGMEAVVLGGLAAGGYGEDRAIYDNESFGAGVAGVEARTLHLGIDIFAGAGTPVFAPRAGRVHSFQDNAASLDYGPTIILEHALTPELTIWSLFGHLSRDSLHGLSIGQAIEKGQKMAVLGDRDVNGGWRPHLHFQLILDLKDNHGDFPGVFRRSERAYWMLVCPDPAGWLGIAP